MLEIEKELSDMTNKKYKRYKMVLFIINISNMRINYNRKYYRKRGDNVECRVLKNKKCKINQYYNSNHPALDIVGENYTLDYITAHSDGIITTIQDNRSNMKGSIGNIAYGNYIKIEHQKGYSTLYAHLQNGLTLKQGQNIKKGDVIGYMGDSGNAYGKHLHFEIWKNNQRINPLEFLNKELPSSIEQPKIELKYNIGDIVNINGVYISSTSNKELKPLITKGTITKIIANTRNPYLIDNGKIGWVNDKNIISLENTNINRYLSNKNYQGISIVDALKEINIDTTYQYRQELAKLNNINNYQGTPEQNIKMLNLLKQGKLKY